jgi:hypothetical protein
MQKERNPKVGTKPNNPLTYLLTILSHGNGLYLLLTCFNTNTFFSLVKAQCVNMLYCVYDKNNVHHYFFLQNKTYHATYYCFCIKQNNSSLHATGNSASVQDNGLNWLVFVR